MSILFESRFSVLSSVYLYSKQANNCKGPIEKYLQETKTTEISIKIFKLKIINGHPKHFTQKPFVSYNRKCYRVSINYDKMNIEQLQQMLR